MCQNCDMAWLYPKVRNTDMGKLVAGGKDLSKYLYMYNVFNALNLY